LGHIHVSARAGEFQRAQDANVFWFFSSEKNIFNPATKLSRSRSRY